MTVATADGLLGQDVAPSLPATHAVWVVSVDAPVYNLYGKPGAPPARHPYVTEVLDAYSGSLLDAGLGVDSLHAAG